MAASRVGSLKRLLLVHELAFLLLVVVTGAMAGLWAYFWQRNTQESVRLHGMYYAAQQIRGDLFRQIKDVYLARLLAEPDALGSYKNYRSLINENFNRLRRLSDGREEQEAVQGMQQAYRVIQQDMNKAFNDPNMHRVARIRVLDPEQEKDFVAVFEHAVTRLEELIRAREERLEASVERWTRLAPMVMPVPILLAVVLLAVSRLSVQREFVQPIAALMRGARRLREGEAAERIPEQGVQEVVDLAAALNRLAAELSASRDRLVESEKQAALGALVPVIAHNIRNPLAAIRANAQLCADAERPEELAELRQGIIDTVDRLGRWVTALVSYLHPMTPQLVRTTPAALLEAALRLLAPRLADRRVFVVRGDLRPPGELLADADLAEQALYGLLSNAVDASPPGAAVTVAVEARAGRLSMTIDDAGPGMPFDPEPDGLSPGRTTKRFGTGLGIPVAFKVCRAHGWTLDYAAAPGGGTRVRIDAPVAPPA
ncbi:MAG: PAS domain-containing sensor histidine kinase [Gammaproteobacteria bacterium]